MRKILEEHFFNRNPQGVARDLLGKFLIRKEDNQEVALVITETEAYDGTDDKACHASKGRTPRTEVMFGPSGVFYVYLCYGMHWMLNIICHEKNYPAAVLIRGAIALDGTVVDGPGKLTKFLGINQHFNTKKANKSTGLWLEDRGLVFQPRAIQQTSRIGIDYAGPIWAQKPWRFVIRPTDQRFSYYNSKIS